MPAPLNQKTSTETTLESPFRSPANINYKQTNTHTEHAILGWKLFFFRMGADSALRGSERGHEIVKKEKVGKGSKR